jgi:hypothetical protein
MSWTAIKTTTRGTAWKCDACGLTTRATKHSPEHIHHRCRRRVRGPGDELKSLLSMLGFTERPGCKCGCHAKKMNALGCAWCRENLDIIVGWLADEAGKAKLPFSAFIARRLVLLAIGRAERREKRRATKEKA